MQILELIEILDIDRGFYAKISTTIKDSRFKKMFEAQGCGKRRKSTLILKSTRSGRSTGDGPDRDSISSPNRRTTPSLSTYLLRSQVGRLC